MILLDTNILARFADTGHRHLATARLAVRRLDETGEELIMVPQNLYEFWSLATRTRGAPPGGSNGLGLSVAEAQGYLRLFLEQFPVLNDASDLVDRWRRLVVDHGITGHRSHDARLVAAMQTYGIDKILTFNVRDFDDLPITIIDPESFS